MPFIKADCSCHADPEESSEESQEANIDDLFMDNENIQ